MEAEEADEGEEWDVDEEAEFPPLTLESWAAVMLLLLVLLLLLFFMGEIREGGGAGFEGGGRLGTLTALTMVGGSVGRGTNIGLAPPSTDAATRGRSPATAGPATTAGVAVVVRGDPKDAGKLVTTPDEDTPIVSSPLSATPSIARRHKLKGVVPEKEIHIISHTKYTGQFYTQYSSFQQSRT
jgi:hypothetical protein